MIENLKTENVQSSRNCLFHTDDDNASRLEILLRRVGDIVSAGILNSLNCRPLGYIPQTTFYTVVTRRS